MDFNLAYIEERDTDFALLREMKLSNDVRNLFLNKVKMNGELISSYHSFVDQESPGKDGESDLVFVFKQNDGKRFVIFVEDKINAPAQPEQSKRYLIRAKKFINDNGIEITDHYVFLFAPKDYLNKNESKNDYIYFVAHEDVRDLCKDELDKIVFTKSCEVKQGSNKVIDKNKTEFWNALIDYIKEYPYDFKFTKSKVNRGQNSYWPEFGTNVSGLKVIYKSNFDCIDLSFDRMGNRRNEVIDLFKELDINIKEYYFEKTRESLALKKDTSNFRVCFDKPFEEQVENIKHIIDEVKKLIEIAKKIGNNKDLVFPI